MPPTIAAAGTVLLRRAPGGAVQVCVLHRPRQNDWSLPKGKCDPGEPLLLTARRETWEETTCKPILGPPLERQSYKVDGRPKTVDYWVGWVQGRPPRFRRTKEVDRLEWLSPSRAMAKLTYPRDRALVAEAVGLPASSPLIILRHTQALKRNDYKGRNDQKRPLSKEGRAEAKELVALLLAYGISEVHSSDSLRCLATVRPLARRLHVPVIEEPLFSEEIFRRKPKTALRRAEVLSRRPAPLVLCTHRPVLPAVVSDIADQFHVKSSIDELDPALPPGGFIVIHRELGSRGRPNGRVLGVERHADWPG